MNSSTTRGRKRSKWDQTPSEVVKPSEAAAEAAARLNAKLAAEGKLVLSNPPQLPPTSATSSSVLASTAAAAAATGTSKEQTCGFFSAEVEINNCIARSELIKTTTLTEINRATGAFVSVRGKYLTSEEQSDSNEKERSQYLHVQSTTQERVNNAVQRIKAIMIGEVTSKMPTMSQQHYVQDKVFIGMDHAPEAFCLLDRLSGPGGSYLAHIAQQTGAKVYLRGKGSGYLEPTSGREAFEALYLYISHPTQNGMVEAKKLCESLVSTVKKDLQQFTTPQGYGAQTSPYPPNMLQPPFYNQYHMMPHGHGPGVLPQQPYAQSIPPSHPPLQGSGTDVVPPPPFQYFSAMPPPPPPYVGAPQHMGPPPPLPMYGALPIPPPPPHTATIPVQSTVLPMEGYPERQPDNSSNTGTQDTSYSNSQSLATSTTNATDTKTPDKPAKRRFTEKPTIQPEILKSSLSVNTYTDQTINSQPVEERVSDQVIEDDKKNKEQPPINSETVDNFKGQIVEEESDKWKPVANSKISDNKKDDRFFMPPPSGGFMFRKPSMIPPRDRVFPAKRPVPKSDDTTDIPPTLVELKQDVTKTETKVLQNEDDNSEDDEDDKPIKKLKLVVYGDSDSE